MFIEPKIPRLAITTSNADGAARSPSTVIDPPPKMGCRAAFGSREISNMLQLIQDNVPMHRRLVREEQSAFQAGQKFDSFHIINTGSFRLQMLSGEGREQVVGLHFKGDWMGLDGIAGGQYGCDAVAMDTAEIWVIDYEVLLHAAVRVPALLAELHSAMSRELVRDHHAMLSLCTLPADARVASFLRHLAISLEERGLRNDQITLRMSRAQIGNYLGMTLETVSRALTRLVKSNVIHFPEKGRRDIQIPEVEALSNYILRICETSATFRKEANDATARAAIKSRGAARMGMQH